MFRTRFSKTSGSMLAAALFGVLTVVGCSDDEESDGGGGGSGGNIGATLTINEQVYYNESEYSGNPDNTTREIYTPFDGNLTVTAVFSEDDVSIGGNGGITNGRLNFTIGTPSNLRNAVDFFEGRESEFGNVSISNPNARVMHFDWFNTHPNGRLRRHRDVITRNTNTQRARHNEFVVYMYVDRDVRVSGSGTTMTRSFALNFKEGWNAMHVKFEQAGTYSAANDDWSYTYTQSISLGDPSNIKWILQDDYYDKRRDDNDWLNTTRITNIFSDVRGNAK